MTNLLSQGDIDNLLTSLSVEVDEAQQQPTTAKKQGMADKRKYKPYNFRRPDKFSKDHLRALQTVHENFARQLGLVLTAYLRTTIRIDVVSVDQLTYNEFIESMPSPMTVSIMEMAPLSGQVLMGMGSEITAGIIDRMLGGQGASLNKKPKELTDIEQSLIRRIVDRSLACLEEAWQSMIEVNINMMAMEESYALIQVATPGEIVALVTFEVSFGTKDSGLMSLCIPYPVVEEVIGQLSAQRIFHGRTEETSQEHHQKVLGKIHYAKMPIQVYLGGTQISVNDLVALSVGDVVRLDKLASDNLLMCVNHRPKFYCRPGTRRNHLAVYVVEEMKHEEAIEGFGCHG